MLRISNMNFSTTLATTLHSPHRPYNGRSSHLLVYLITLFLLSCLIVQSTCSTQATIASEQIHATHVSVSSSSLTPSGLSTSIKSKAVVPKEWFCSPEHYNSSDGCHCLCGAHDPDCDTTPQGLSTRTSTTLDISNSKSVADSATSKSLMIAINCPCPEQQFMFFASI